MDFFYCVALSHGFLFLQAPSAAGVSARGQRQFFLCFGLIPTPTAMRASLGRTCLNFFCFGRIARGENPAMRYENRAPRAIALRADKRHLMLYMANAIMLQPANTSKKIYNPRRKRRREKISRKDRKIPQSSRMRRRRYIFHQRRKFRQQPAK